MSKRCLFISIIICSYIVSNAQNASRFLHFNVRDGLSQNSVHCIFQDKDGLMWIGTQDGLNSFDGKDFTIYRHDDNDSTTISDQFIIRIQEDKQGDLWIGTRNGLNRFNKRTRKFTRFYIDEYEKHVFQATYFNFYFQRDGKIIIPRKKAIILDPVTKAIQQVALPESAVLLYADDNYKGYFINYKNQQLICDDIRRSSFRLIHEKPLSFDGTITTWGVKAASERMIYYNLGDKLIPYDHVADKLFEPINIPYHVNSVHIASANESYAATSNGIYKITNNKELSFLKNNSNDKSSLTPGAILCTYVDRESNIWIGTAGNGFAVSNRSFNNYIMLNSPIENGIVSCIYKKDNNIYFGSSGGLYVTSKSSDEATLIAPKKILADKKITGLTMDMNGMIWAAIENEGIWVLNTTGNVLKKFDATNSILEKASIIQLNTDSKGRILISTENKFYVAPSLDIRTWIKFSGSSSQYPLIGNYVMSAFEDKDKQLWIATNMGIDVYDTDLNHVKSFASNTDSVSGIKRTIVTNCTQDKNGAIWISTIRNGVYRYVNNSFTHYTASAGLSSEVVYNVLCDEKNRIWAVTSAGLNILDKDQNSFTTLAPLDGIPNTAFVLNAVFKDQEGTLFFGTSDGLLLCNANNIDLHRTTISAGISDIKVNGQSVDISSKKLSLILDNKVISFEFTAAPEFFSGNIIYQYRLKGLSDEWTTLPRSVHSISYTGLPYKTLQLEVRAATSFNNLDKAGISTITIQSKPPFWKTSWFIIFCALLFIGFIWMLLMEFNKRKYRRQLQTQRMEKQLQTERERIGRDLHDNIGAYTSALIAGLNQVKPADDEQVKHVDDLKEYAVSIMGFLRETIWMLNTQTLTVTAFTDRFKNYALRINKNYPAVELHIKENINNNKTLAPGIMLNLFRILQEALQNAYKHANASAIQILFKSDGLLHFEVFDNGAGFTEQEKEEHYGLSNMRQRATEAGFTLTINSTTGNGTTVSIVENTAYAASTLTDNNINL